MSIGKFLRDCPETPMRLFCIISAALLLWVGVPYSALGTQETQTTQEAQTRGVDVILVVDLSKTMRGYGDAADIFDRVKATAKNLVRELDEGDTMTLIPFGDAARALPTVTIYGDTERRRLFERIDELEANQSWTYTAEALRMSLQEASRLQNTFSDHRQVVFILTDGRNNPPPGAPDGYNLDIAELVDRPPSEPWYVYQVQYGDRVDQSLDSLITDSEVLEGETIQDEDAQGGIDSLRTKVDRARSFSWSASPSSITVELESSVDTASASVQFDLPEGVGVRSLEATLNRSKIPEGIILNTEVLSRPENRAEVNLTAQATGPLSGEKYEGSLRIPFPRTEGGPEGSPLEIPVTVQTRSFKWSASPTSIAIVLESLEDTASASVQFDLPDGVGAGAINVGLDRSEIPKGVTLDYEIVSRPKNRAELTFTARATRSLANGEYGGAVRVSPPSSEDDSKVSSLEIPLMIQTSMVTPTWLRWLWRIGGGLLVLVLGWLGYREWEKRQLFGKLEYWPTEDPNSSREKDLGQYGMSATIGSDLRVRGTNENLGQLSVEKEDGQRMVIVRPEEGNELVHGDTTEQRLPLYDRDQFEIGDYTFEYNAKGEVSRRPRRRSRRR